MMKTFLHSLRVNSLSSIGKISKLALLDVKASALFYAWMYIRKCFSLSVFSIRIATYSAGGDWIGDGLIFSSLQHNCKRELRRVVSAIQSSKTYIDWNQTISFAELGVSSFHLVEAALLFVLPFRWFKFRTELFISSTNVVLDPPGLEDFSGRVYMLIP